MKTVRGGKNPGSSAHWQVVFAYAKYLSPEFYMWCNQVVCERMEGKTAQHQMTPAEMFLHSAQMIVAIEQRQAEQAREINTITENLDRMAQSLTTHDKVPPNGELVTHLRKRIAKKTDLSFEVINRVLDMASVQPKFAVRNHHENAESSVNYGYWQREINLIFSKFISECAQVTPTMCTHPYIDGRFRLVKGSE
ncbi:hypothetical protein M8994_07075 [Brucella sp. 21LCYQ03]|nr:hypothetical protein [Brucella sp. 21LCYQ03]